MHPDLAQILLIAALAAVGLAILVPLITHLVHKLFFFDWPPLYEWQQARRQLPAIDRWRVVWATYRHHPASRATLADAQLVHARHRQAATQWALDRQRLRWRVVATVLFSAVAAGLVASAATYKQQQLFYWPAASYTFLALATGLGPRSARRLTERMTRLQTQIEDRYTRRVDAAPPRPRRPGLRPPGMTRSPFR